MSIRFKNLAAAAASAAFLLVGQQAVAQQRGACCDSCWDLCGDWEVRAHALYFTPVTCPYTYVNEVVSINTPGLSDQVGRAEAVPCAPAWGFRVFGNYLRDCFFVGVSYQWLDITTARSIVNPDLQILGGQTSAGVERGIGRVKIEYQNVDVRLGRYYLQGCRGSLYFYGNARWIDLSHRRSARLVSVQVVQETQERSELEGGALGIGFGGDLDIWCNFGAFIDGNLLGVIGRRSLKDARFRTISIVNPTVDSRQIYPSDTCVIPEVDFRIGLNYTYECGCWALVGEVGYEVDHFWNGSMFPDLVTTINDNIQQRSPRDFVPVCEDLGFSGLFFGARFIF